MSRLPSVFWSQVGASARWRYLVFPGHPGLENALVSVTAIALLGAMVGALLRFCCFVSGLLLYHLAPLESLIWIPHPYARGFTISVIALLTLSFSPWLDAAPVEAGQAVGGQQRLHLARSPAAALPRRDLFLFRIR